MGTIFHKIHKVAGEKEILAIADKELIGKTLKGKKITLEIKESFYKGEELTQEQLKKLLHQFTNINIVGNQAVEIALQEKLATKKQVIEVDGIKHLQIFVV